LVTMATAAILNFSNPMKFDERNPNFF
jgi:hypothetical protein